MMLRGGTFGRESSRINPKECRISHLEGEEQAAARGEPGGIIKNCGQKTGRI